MMKIFSIIFIAFIAMLGTGCAGPGSAQKTEQAVSVESQASARAEARWKAMIAKDLGQAYTYLSPGSKALNSLELFKGKIKPLNWKSARAASVQCEQEKCTVMISLTFEDSRIGGEVTTVLAETWLKDSGQWWLVFN